MNAGMDGLGMGLILHHEALGEWVNFQISIKFYLMKNAFVGTIIYSWLGIQPLLDLLNISRGLHEC